MTGMPSGIQVGRTSSSQQPTSFPRKLPPQGKILVRTSSRAELRSRAAAFERSASRGTLRTQLILLGIVAVLIVAFVVLLKTGLLTPAMP